MGMKRIKKHYLKCRAAAECIKLAAVVLGLAVLCLTERLGNAATWGEALFWLAFWLAAGVGAVSSAAIGITVEVEAKREYRKARHIYALRHNYRQALAIAREVSV